MFCEQTGRCFPPGIAEDVPDKYGWGGEEEMKEVPRCVVGKGWQRRYLVCRVVLIGLCPSCFMPLFTDLMVHHLSSPLVLNLVK